MLPAPTVRESVHVHTDPASDDAGMAIAVRDCSICGRPMPAGRSPDYCGKRCRRAARRRGRPIDGPTDTIEAFVAFLRRVERTVAASVGAGLSVPEAWDEERWRRELEDDLVDAPELAGHLLAGVRANLHRVTSAGDVHRVFELMLDRVPVLASAIDRARAELAPSPHLVYLLHDRRGLLLFVGITDEGPKRLVDHYGRKPWFADVARVDFERAATREEAVARAGRLVETRRPRYR